NRGRRCQIDLVRVIQGQDWQLLRSKPAVTVPANCCANDVGGITECPRMQDRTGKVSKVERIGKDCTDTGCEVLFQRIPARRGHGERVVAGVFWKRAAASRVVARTDDKPGTGAR